MRYFFILSFFLIIQNTHAQQLVNWSVFANVTFQDEYSAEYGTTLTKATFGEAIKKYKDKTVYVKGYMIPLDALGTTYVISQNPNASCFFCGGAGPETIVHLKLSPKSMKRYKTDEYLTFKGTLKLNDANGDAFHYVLMNAERQ